ncbi:MAG: HDOD domain-containing protein [Phycisphaerae bacterium]|nr:HDOD domain-containing protein [Phycisphaerae bacterium]
MPTAAETENIVNKALAGLGEIATLPEITVRIIETVENPKSTARDLHEIIKNDPALSAKILKVVNSAFYGLPGQIGSIDRAIVLLGLSAVKNIAIAASITRLFKGKQLTKEFTARDLWTHSLAVGVASRLIHKQIHKQGGDDIFLAGLIHDLGIMTIRQAYPDRLTEIVDRVYETEEDYCAVETEILGVDHQAFGAGLGGKWKFPRHLRAVMGYHHCPEQLDEDNLALVRIIQLADIICCRSKLGFYLTSHGKALEPEHLVAIGVNSDQIAEVIEQLPEQLSIVESMMS